MHATAGGVTVESGTSQKSKTMTVNPSPCSTSWNYFSARQSM